MAGSKILLVLNDEATVQHIRDDIMRWDLDKAGSWDLYVEGIERL